ncbi:N-acetylmuramidase family protein [Paraburkholderia phenoliruptrix]|uniref:N-acetylmuramidase family protein n=2 Tax=Pseudomonadota TaxID=1224 RepID=UPI001C4E911C|nr:N-acetylmuramidase family protein [Paraburkholderia phenoliruptrix]MBW0449238.1 N-acetylmuramidase family protein [Paraburkholderia phenoliruptrix]MBW9097518.1 N-acetylmuramidase family protein [Paraburkholderia phenoliruptrix]
MANHHHPAAPTPPSPPQWQPLKWSFPFPPAIGDSADPQTWLTALSNTDSGFFPLGSNGMFHGGIHFDARTGGKLKQGDGVKVIADGEVVAYRLDSAYPELTYPTSPPRYALYSTGFVLVRHRLVLPPEPKPSGAPVDAPAASAAAATPSAGSSAQAPHTCEPPADDVLEFFSLYMHQLDWKGYQRALTSDSDAQSGSAIRPLPFWHGDKSFRVGTKANDRQAEPPQPDTPLCVREPSGGLGMVSPGSSALLDGVALGPTLGSADRSAQYGDRVRYTVPSTGPAEGSQGADTPQVGVRLCDRANGMVIGLLPRGGELKVVGNAPRGWAQVAAVTKGTVMAAVAGGTPDPRAATGWVNLDELDAIIDPKPLDAVVVLDKPFKVNAGDVVGYLGEYQNFSEASVLPPKLARPQLHVEVFTGAQINDFISRSRDRASKLPDGGKTLLVIQQGARLITVADPQSNVQLAGLTLALAKDDPGKGRWAFVQPTQVPTQSSAQGHGHGHTQAHARPHHTRGTPVGNPLWVERKYAGKVAGATAQTWTDFPLQPANAAGSAVAYQQVLSRAQLGQLSEPSKATDGKGTQWWSICAGDADGRTILGWVCEKGHRGTQWQSPWSWPGFDTVDTTAIGVIDMYRRNLFEAKQLFDGQEAEFSPVAAMVNAGALIGKLEKAAKRQGSGKGNVVPADLRRALTVPWLAEAVSHVIVRYESEWGGDMSKWEALSRLMGNAKSIWQVELERIKHLQWWSKVSAVNGFPANPDVWHIHPIGLVGNFARSTAHPCITVQEQRIELQFLQKSNGRSLSAQDYVEAAMELGCESQAIKAVAKTETGSSGPYFRPGQDLAAGDDPVPAILFERHLFHRATHGIYDQSHPRISNPAPGGYGTKAIQYEKLMEAYALDPTAALMSASWGRFQILGSNFKAAGFQSVQDYVESISESEANQLRAFVSFIKSDAILKRAICSKDWHGFAVRYNGPAQHGYDTAIARNYREVSE